MDNELKTRLKDEMERRGIKVPAVADQLGIPRDRIYAWYRDNTEPKSGDARKIEKWLAPSINEEISNNEFSAGQLFHMYMRALDRQDKIMEIQTALLQTQTALLKQIESKMALESSLQETLAGVETIADRQEKAIETMNASFAVLKRKRTVS